MLAPELGCADMRRREFISLLGGAAAWPLAAYGQQGRLPVVGVLRPNPKDTEPFVEPFRNYMKAIGWEEGRNIRFLFAWMEGRNERGPQLAGDSVAQNVAPACRRMTDRARAAPCDRTSPSGPDRSSRTP